MTEYDLTGRAALITGASQGLGLAAAKCFASSGADLFLCARGFDRLREAAKEAESLRRRPEQRVLFMSADVSRQDDVDRLAEAALQTFPELRILLSNAGVYGPRAGSRMSPCPTSGTPWR